MYDLGSLLNVNKYTNTLIIAYHLSTHVVSVNYAEVCYHSFSFAWSLLMFLLSYLLFLADVQLYIADPNGRLIRCISII